MKIYHLNNILIWLEYHKPTTESNNEENEEIKKLIAMLIVQNGKFN